VLAIGFLVGVVLKKTVKLGLAILSLVGLLIATGYINLQLSDSSKATIYRVFFASTNGSQPGIWSSKYTANYFRGLPGGLGPRNMERLNLATL
jgi:hypothetical protein